MQIILDMFTLIRQARSKLALNLLVTVTAIVMMLLVLRPDKCDAMRMTEDTVLQYCPSAPVLWKGGTDVQLDSNGLVVSGVLAKDTSIRYCSGESTVFMAGTRVTFDTSLPQNRCQVVEGVLAQDTALRYSASGRALFRGGTQVTFQTSPPEIRCLVRQGTLAQDTGIHQVGKVGSLTTYKAGTTVTFNSKGLVMQGDSGSAKATPIPQCKWDPFPYFHKAAVSQPSRLSPLQNNSPLPPGRYLVHVGPAGENGQALPPSRVKTFGPKKLEGGHSYSAVMADRGETLRWRSDDDPELNRFDKPPKNEAVIFARNEASPTEWYAICVTPAGGAAPAALSVSVHPNQLSMKSGEKVTTEADVAGGSPPYKYQWFNNGKESKTTGAKIKWTMRGEGTRIIKLIVRDSEGRTAQAESTIVVHAGTPSPEVPPTTAPKTPPTTQKPPQPPAPPTTPPQAPPKEAGWHLEGSPAISKSPYPKVECSHFGYSLAVSDGSASGSQSWKDCTNQTKCSGTYTGTVTWTKLPSYLKPGSKITVDAAAQTSAQNTCGYQNIGSGITVKGAGLYIDVIESKSPKGSSTATVPNGSPGSKITIEVSVKAANLHGKVAYSYVYR